MQSKWRIKDLIDLEYFLNQKSAQRASNKSSADALSFERRTYLSYEKTHQPPFSRRDLIKHWVDANRKTADADTLPGDAYAETISLLRVILTAVAMISGASLAWSVLSYSGTAPINIFTCIWILIIPQFILLAILAISMTASRVGLPLPFKGLYSLLSSLIARMLGRTKISGDTSLTGHRRMQLYAVAGLIGRQKTLYGPVFFWPVFILAQIFGVFFNIGLLAATLLKLAITDLAFGWQSTLHPDAETVYRIVEIFSLPWSWLPSAHPAIDQIQGSQMILKQGMIHLTTPNLVSWWPFLCYALLFYGLLPRLILLATGWHRQIGALGSMSFSTSACDRLIQQMRAPQVLSAGQAYASQHSKKKYLRQPEEPVARQAITPAALAPDPAFILIPEEIEGSFDDADLKERITYILGHEVITRIPVTMNPATDMAALDAAFSRTGVSPEFSRIVILMEAWQPPIREALSWLKHLRNTVQKETGIIIALIGKPADQMIFTSPGDTDRVIWEQAVSAMGDPFIRVENLGGG